MKARARRVGEHIEHIDLLFAGIYIGLIYAFLLPFLLPLLFYRRMIKFLVHKMTSKVMEVIMP
jgi:hypothetical protein